MAESTLPPTATAREEERKQLLARIDSYQADLDKVLGQMRDAHHVFHTQITTYDQRVQMIQEEKRKLINMLATLLSGA